MPIIQSFRCGSKTKDQRYILSRQVFALPVGDNKKRLRNQAFLFWKYFHKKPYNLADY
jgi:hypothetical protein